MVCIKRTIFCLCLMVLMFLFVAGCSSPVCYPPNKILGNKCCVDYNNDGVCDYDAVEVETTTDSQGLDSSDLSSANTDTEQENERFDESESTEPVNSKYSVSKSASVEELEEHEVVLPSLGKSEIALGEPRKYLELNEITSYRSSRDKGVVDEMTFTVRNIGQTELNGVLELFFDGTGVDYTETERINEYETKIKKEYTIESLKPGEKVVFKKSLGIRFQGIEYKKLITFDIYEKYSAPKTSLETLEYVYVPVKEFPTMEIFTFGPNKY